ncbi:MAG: pentapeptide repeat-containing protein [Thermodesulfobacteriota bacterium]
MIKRCVLFLFLIPLFTGCAATTEKTIIKQGGVRLTAAEVFKLISNNTIHLESTDFEAKVFFKKNGRLAARNIIHNADDLGRWDISEEGQLCYRYTIWYHGDIMCETIYREMSGKYLFLTKKGTLAYTATRTMGDPLALSQNIEEKSKSSFVRKDLAKDVSDGQPAAAPSQGAEQLPAVPENKELTIKQMAKNCPGCSLKDADLRQANLVQANLKGADLRGADLSRANLRRADLSEADLRGATLLSTNLPGVNLRGADLSGADFSGANLLRADLTDADVEDTIFNNAHLNGVKGLKGRP